MSSALQYVQIFVYIKSRSYIEFNLINVISQYSVKTTTKSMPKVVVIFVYMYIFSVEIYSPSRVTNNKCTLYITFSTGVLYIRISTARREKGRGRLFFPQIEPN